MVIMVYMEGTIMVNMENMEGTIMVNMEKIERVNESRRYEILSQNDAYIDFVGPPLAHKL
jgi:hypothetical protein